MARWQELAKHAERINKMLKGTDRYESQCTRDDYASGAYLIAVLKVSDRGETFLICRTLKAYAES